jgi:hypothetical protein
VGPAAERGHAGAAGERTDWKEKGHEPGELHRCES